jgi:hypothetical protein
MYELQRLYRVFCSKIRLIDTFGSVGRRRVRDKEMYFRDKTI